MSTASGRKPEAALAEWEATIKRQLPAALDAVAAVYKYEVQQMLSRPGTGRLYLSRRLSGVGGGFVMTVMGKLRKRKSTDMHRASADGEPPAPDLGELKRGIYIEKDGLFRRIVGSRMLYSAPLELGTKTIAPRPFMRPALLAALEKMNIAFRTVLKQNDSVKL